MYVISCSMWICKIAGSQKNDNTRLFENILMALIVLLPSVCTCAQDTTNNYVPPLVKNQVTSVAVIDFFTTFSGINVINGETSNEFNNIYLYYNFSVNNKLKSGKFVMLTYYFTECGMRKYFDSITSISDDQYNFKNSISYRIRKSRFTFNLSISSKSQYFNHYDYKEDSLGKMERYLFTSYLSPGYSNFSGGLKYEFNDNCAIELGLVNGRNTKIRNQALFDSRGVNKLYGLDKGLSKKMEFGFNLIVSVPTHRIFKNFYVENFSQFNINRDKILDYKDYKVDINNAFHYKLFKSFRLSLRTKLIYDININTKPKIINYFTVGFYLNNMF